MSHSFLHTLLTMSAASSVAMLIVGLLRKPLQLLSGAIAAYWLWLVVPAAGLAALLPGPAHSVQSITGW